MLTKTRNGANFIRLLSTPNLLSMDCCCSANTRLPAKMAGAVILGLDGPQQNFAEQSNLLSNIFRLAASGNGPRVVEGHIDGMSSMTKSK